MPSFFTLIIIVLMKNTTSPKTGVITHLHLLPLAGRFGFYLKLKPSCYAKFLPVIHTFRNSLCHHVAVLFCTGNTFLL